jgi:hypothetical protein
MSSSSRPILFVSLPESGLFNPVQTIAGEFARRGVPDLWFATDEERRGDIEALSDESTVRFASLGVVGVADHGGVRGEPLRARDLGVDVLVPRQGRQLRHHVPE